MRALVPGVLIDYMYTRSSPLLILTVLPFGLTTPILFH